MDRVYLNRAYNCGRRRDNNEFMDDIRSAAARQAVAPNDTKALLDNYIEGLVASGRVTSPRMYRDMFNKLEDIIREAYLYKPMAE